MWANRATKTGLLVGLVLLIGPAVEAGTVLYVDDDGASGGDGSSWATCCRFLQEALLIASDPINGVGEIHVSQGTYMPDRDEATPGGSSDRTATFQLIDGVAVRGGYAGPGAPDPDARDVDLYETVLSGDLLGDDLPGFVNNGENSWHIVTASGTDSTALVDGFTITAGNANGPGWPNVDSTGAGMLNITGSPTVTACRFESNWADEAGAGMFNAYDSLATVTDCEFLYNAVDQTSFPSASGGMYNGFGSDAVVTECHFERNSAFEGGGMANQLCNPQVTNCTFAMNSARQGGGIENYDNADALITGCTFNANTGEIGGAVLNWISCSATITDCLFIANNTTDNGGAMFNEGGSHPTLENCTFTGNTSGYNGGAIHNYNLASPSIVNCVFEANEALNNGGAMYNRVGSHPTITACTFIGNIAQLYGGGAIRNYSDCSPTVTACTFRDNIAGGGGGAIRNNLNSSPIVIDCIFDGNVAGGSGGGVMNYENCNVQLTNCTFTSNSAAARSGGMRDGFNCSSILTNCTFSDNSAGEAGGAITVGSDTAVPVGKTVVYNCILWNNTAPLGPEIALIGNFPAELTVSYSDARGGETDVYVQPGFTLNWGNGNIDADPLFVAPASDDYRLASGSPANDAGHNWAIAPLAATDLDGNPRFADDPAAADSGCGVPVIVDMGAYELQGAPGDVRLADLDGDGVVGILDFLALLAYWGPCAEACCLADLDMDGNVGITDFLILLANWG